MTEKKLQNLYRTEVQALTEHLQDFAKRHPQIALRLQMKEGVAHDPLLAQLLDAFAYASARLQYKNQMDTQFIFEALMQLLFPQFLLPTPAFSTVAYQVSAQTEPGTIIPAHATMCIEEQSAKKISMQSCYPVCLFPIQVSGCCCHENKRCLDIEILNLQLQRPLSQQPIKELTFFIHLPFDKACEVYELFFLYCQGIAILQEPGEEERCVPLSHLQTRGYHQSDSIFPVDNTSAEYIWLEYFSYPAKFQFIVLKNLQSLFADLTNKAVLRFYFSKSLHEIKSDIQASSFQLFCTPVVNIVPYFSDPIRVDQETIECPIGIGGLGAAQPLTIFNIDAIEAYSAYSRKPLTTLPFFSQHYLQFPDINLRWYFRRKKDSLKQPAQVFLRVSVCGAPLQEEITVVAKLQCMQDDIFYSQPAVLRLNSIFSLAVQEAKVLQAFTAPQEKIDHANILPTLLCLLQQTRDFFSKDLRNCLLCLLSCFSDSNAYQAGIVDLKVTEISQLHPHPLQFGFVVGKQITLVVDEAKFPSRHILIFAEVLRHYLLLLAPLNMFITMTLSTLQRGHLKTWPAAVGGEGEPL